MRILEITSDGDYGVVEFENVHGGVEAKAVMDNPENFQPEEEGAWTLKVHDVEGDITGEAASFIKRHFIDYDHKKHQCFFVEGESIEVN